MKACVLAWLCAALSASSPIVHASAKEVQHPLVQQASPASQPARKLQGRFLHITDLHPDPFYKIHSSTDEYSACHRNSGPAGTYGAETSDCDSPFSLLNATFEWIEANLKDSIDFVIWTGDSARHDNDEDLPRTAEQVFDLNEKMVAKFVEVFGADNDTDAVNDMLIPIIPTFGNNDILPHNILSGGPNRYTRKFSSIWHRFIPEEQRHGFEHGGWFYVEVIPQRLAVFSLNTLYFFDSNVAVDGCAEESEPGHQQMEWLRIQLQFMRERGMKAILSGHVPPARTDKKMSWDETCWQRYTLWLDRYRDVVVGSIYGHMNIDHFMLQDFHEVDISALEGMHSDERAPQGYARTYLEDEFTIQSASEYLADLRDDWSKIPTPPSDDAFDCEDGESSDSANTIAKKKKSKKGKKKKGKQSKKERFLKKIGGPWGERFAVSLVGPSIVPNYFPSLRVVEYNTTDMEKPLPPTISAGPTPLDKQKPTLPLPPSKSSPPGPAYSPQPLSWTGYTQYYANLTHINNDFPPIDATKWHEGKHSGKRPHDKHPQTPLQPRPFTYQVEYATHDRGDEFGLRDLTVRSWLTLAGKIGTSKGECAAGNVDIDGSGSEEEEEEDGEGEAEAEKKKKKKKKKKKNKKKKHRGRNGGAAARRAWHVFLRRAFVGAVEEEEGL